MKKMENKKKWQFLVLAAVAALWPALAMAHAHVTASVPKRGEMIMRPLHEVTLTFSESVEPSFSKVEVTESKTGAASLV